MGDGRLFPGQRVDGAEDRDEHRWAPHVRADRQLALERSPRLSHMTGRNWFFVTLARHAREHGGELREWLNEAERGTFGLELSYALVQRTDCYVVAGESDIATPQAVGQGLGNALDVVEQG
ncbi:MAG TPA: hypothetical protein VIY52_11420 [Streptosporangiaceae bacterium]